MRSRYRYGIFNGIFQFISFAILDEYCFHPEEIATNFMTSIHSILTNESTEKPVHKLRSMLQALILNTAITFLKGIGYSLFIYQMKRMSTMNK